MQVEIRCRRTLPIVGPWNKVTRFVKYETVTLGGGVVYIGEGCETTAIRNISKKSTRWEQYEVTVKITGQNNP